MIKKRRIAEEQTLPEDVALYFCSFDKGRSKLEALDIDPDGNITNWPPDFFGDDMGEMVAMLEASIKRRRVGA